MFKTAVRHAVVIGLVALTCAGCGQQAVETPSGDDHLLVMGPASEAMAEPPEYVSEILASSGGLDLWRRQTRLRADGVVKLYQPDGSFYLSEHDLDVYPWSNAVRIEANEPRARFVWQLAEGRYQTLEGQAPLDVSPLAGSYGTYADAVLHIVTVPVRLLDEEAELYREPAPIHIRGQWYQRIVAKFYPARTASKDRGGERLGPAEFGWTDGVYFLNRGAGLIDMIWLGSETRQEYIMVRGYDYPPEEPGVLRVPSKVEIFRADAEGNVKERLAELDVSGR
ncbi:MAG: hypothetical protein JSW27_13990 [Phycisphaerales bacterium]|nr:MAG: hypothetical protein JSW27_13990 [Phycisphaerales bacterium]